MIAILEEEIKKDDVFWKNLLGESSTCILKKSSGNGAKCTGIHVLEVEIEVRIQALCPGTKHSERDEAQEQGNKDFYIQQAEVLGVSPKEYFKFWRRKDTRLKLTLKNTSLKH
ncbi:hypothetical protein [Bacillus sp. FJAT-44742]|uniref:hypothetical protein n=1 Tax=Bacillus sp. FJAT-44742 TaxID=2014005 RepID=UPI000C243629|nr:hypothetical protein [Bacillus sp. FJAT-44742]